MSMLVDEYTFCLDPTCGSGSALRAAESLGATRILGLESDYAYCEAARKALREARSKAALHGMYL
jgi:predicted RNA methylase